jgi:protein SCO1/2
MSPVIDITHSSRHISKDTPEEEIAAFIDTVRQSPDRREILVDLLPERHSLYRDRGANQIIRIRGYILASFEYTGLPQSALIYVLQELESNLDAYVVAASAKAIRGMEHPTRQVVPYLLTAINNMMHMDDAISFEVYKTKGEIKNYTTAKNELLHTLSWLGAYAKEAIASLEQLQSGSIYYVSDKLKSDIDKTIQAINNDEREVESLCCNLNFKFSSSYDKGLKSFNPDILKTALEDQDGKVVAFDQFFKHKPSVVAFFYTRCNNPNKCSLTITKLVQLRRGLEAEGIDKSLKISAITYDPGYDIPSRLKIYGENRGFAFDERNRFFRVEPENHEELIQYFKLGVNYSGSIINQHRIELFILNSEGEIAHSFTNLQWEIKEVTDAIKQANNDVRSIKKPKHYVNSYISNVFRNTWSVMPAIVVAFFPKCPVCWAAYLSMFGIAGLNTIPYSPWLLPVFYGVMGINLIILYLFAKQRNGYLPFYVSLTGAIFLLGLGLTMKIKFCLYIGISLVFLGSLLNSFSYRLYLKLINTFRI